MNWLKQAVASDHWLGRTARQITRAALIDAFGRLVKVGLEPAFFVNEESDSDTTGETTDNVT